MSRYYIVSTIFLVTFIVSLILDGPVHVPLVWYIAIGALYILCTIVGAIKLSLGFYVDVKSSGDADAIALTFDDGPVPGKTDKILDILRQKNLRAAFFCIGHKVASYPSMVQRMHEDGHLIGNHSFFHKPTFDLQSSGMITKELAETDAAIIQAIGKRVKFFRPPYGVTNPMVAKAVGRRNYTVVGWSVRSFDTVIRDEKKLFRRVTKGLRGGDILLFHDHCDATVAILPALLDHIAHLGLKVVRVDELIKEKPYA